MTTYPINEDKYYILSDLEESKRRQNIVKLLLNVIVKKLAVSTNDMSTRQKLLNNRKSYMAYVREIEDNLWMESMQLPHLREILKIINDTTYGIKDIIKILIIYLTKANNEIKHIESMR